VDLICRRSSGRRCLRLAAALAVLLVWPTLAEAIPAFARKYHTSCQTCHAMFPKLNAFGEAFRLKGFRMPGETEEMIKEKPVSLGAPAYKRLWPKAIWPGELPGGVPLAVNIKFADVNVSSVNSDGTVTHVWNDLQFPQELNIFGGGNLGDHFSFFSEVTFGENPDGSVAVELEHATLQFDSIFGPEDAVHLRVGKFAPNLVDGFQEMWIATDAAIDSLFAYDPIGPNGGTGLAGDQSPMPISIPAIVRGIEGYGIIRHRVLWVAGLVNGISPGPNGSFDGNNAKDLYARLDYKIGGMALDGDLGGKAPPAENWRDNSVRLGVFVYRGDGSNIDFASATDAGDPLNIQDRHFLRSGFYASVYLRDLNVFGAYLHGTDSLSLFAPDTAAPMGSVESPYHAWFTQADYMFYPWLMGSFRYETLTPGDRSVPSLRTGVATLSALIRANVKAMVEYQRDLRDGRNYSVNALVRFAF
jgi:hypothetical protein